MHFVCSYILRYSPFYDDEYEHIHYDGDDDHALHDTRGLLTSKRHYKQLARL